MASSAKPGLSIPQKCALALLRSICRLLALTGYRGVYRLGRISGTILWHVLPSRRKLAVKAIMEHLCKPRDEAVRIARESFCNNMQSFLEIVLASGFSFKNNPRLTYSKAFTDMQDEERPVVATLGHMGAWELLAGVLADYHPDRPRMIVVRNQKSKVMNALIHELRSTKGAEALGHRNVSAEVMAALRGKGTVAFLVDHNTSRREAVFLPFLGKLAAVNIGPAMLALRGKAMVYPLFLVRTGKWDYEIKNYPPLDTAELEGSIQERSRIIAQYYNSAVEDIVRQYPEQWLWMHKRWKTRPKDEGKTPD